MKKRVLALLLALVMALGMLPGAALAAEGAGAVRFSSRGITWDITGELSLDGTLTISGTGGIPDSFGTRGAMGQALGEQKSQVKKIVIEDGITAIGSGAFYSYGALEEIVIPASVRGMDESCFDNCYKLTSVRFLGELPHGELHGELYINGKVTVYCPREYFVQYQHLMTYAHNEAQTSSEYVRPIRLCTSDVPVQVALNETNVFLSAQKPSVQLMASVNGAGISSGVRWSSADPDIAAVDGSGRVTMGQRHGSTLICAEVPFGDGDTALVTCQVYAARNASLVDCLPTSGLEADAPVTCNTIMVSRNGVLCGYKPAKFIERDTGNACYREIAQLTDSLTRDCRTQTEKARAIQQWVSANVEYGGMLGIGDHVSQVYAVYEARSARCQGYSYLTGFMFYLAGIPNAIAISIDHMWNLALLDGRWVMVDSTWREFDFDYDDPDHGYITYIALSQGDCCLIVDDDSGVKLAGVGPHELERDGLTSVAVPDGVSTLYGYSMAYCEDLTAVYLPKSVTSIGEKVFFLDKKLTDIFYAGTEEQFRSIQISNGNDLQSQFTIHYNSTSLGQPSIPDQPTLPTVEPIPATGTAVARTQSVKLDGRNVEFQCYALKNAQGNETNYVKLRDLAIALNGTKAQFNAGWDQASKTISIIPGAAYEAVGGEGATPFSGDQPYTAASSTPISFRGASVRLTSILLQDSQKNGYTYYKLADLGQLLNFSVRWANGVVIETDKPYQ